MAEDPAVDSIEADCLERVDMSLPRTPDLDEAVARRLTVHDGAPWGLDRIDGVDGLVNASACRSLGAYSRVLGALVAGRLGGGGDRRFIYNSFIIHVKCDR